MSSSPAVHNPAKLTCFNTVATSLKLELTTSWCNWLFSKNTRMRKYVKNGFPLSPIVKGNVCWISDSCDQYYPISCDSLAEEM